MLKNKIGTPKFLEIMINKKKTISNLKSKEIFIKNKKNFSNQDPNWFIETYFSLRSWINSSFVSYKKQFEKLLAPFAIYCFINLLEKGFFVEAKIFLLRIKVDVEKKLFDFDKNFINNFYFKKLNMEEVIRIFDEKTYKIQITIPAFNLLLDYSEKQLSWCFLKFLNEKIKIILKKEKNKKVTIKKIGEISKKNEKKMSNKIKKKMPSLSLFKKNSVKICKIFKLESDQKYLVNSFDLSKNEETILTGWQNSNIAVFDQNKENNAKKKFSLIGHTRPVYVTKLSSCNNFVLSGTSNGELNLWSLKFRKLLVKYQNTSEPIWDISFSGSNPFFLTGGANNLASLWASNSLYPVRLFIGHKSDVNVVRWHPSSMIVGTGSSDGISCLWDIRRAKSVAAFEEIGYPVHSLEFSPDGFEVSISGLHDKIYIWDIRTNRFKGSINHTSDNRIVKNFSYSPDGKKFAFTYNQNFVKILDKIPKKRMPERNSFFWNKYLYNLVKIKIGKIFNLKIVSEEKLLIAGIK